MTIIEKGLSVDGKPIIRMENDHLQVDVAPGVGGKMVSVFHKASDHEFVWHNVNLKLELLPPHSEYDPNFYGGIDELLPNDITETINGIECPDHGELWTMALDYRLDGDALVLTGTLPLFGLRYERRLALRADGPYIDLDYQLENITNQRREFLWKLHAALNIEPGDQIECPARTAQVPDLEWSRWHTLDPFDWPNVEGQRADLVPPKDGTMDFLYLYDLEAGRIALKRASKGLTFAYAFDTDVFPYTWLFASYGGFDDHYMAILEPCTTMPIVVNEAAELGQCSALEPGEVIETRVTIYAGPAGV